MKTLVMTTAFALAAIAAVELSQAGEPGCSAEPSCAAPACCDPGMCCPKCGCHEGLVPVCHTYCTTKKVTKYHYCCKCDTICIPSHCPPCPKCGEGCCDQSCNSGCGCDDGCCKCMIRDVHMLVKIPYTVEEPVRKCTVEWVCPRCGCDCGCSQKSEAAPSPATPIMPAPPVPQKSAGLIPAPDVTYAMPRR